MRLRSRNHLDWIRRQKVSQEEVRRRLLIALLQDEALGTSIREYFHIKLAKISRNASPVRTRNRCIWTGRSRGVLKRFRCSRIVFRELAAKGGIMGIQKASW